jgi:DNA gyrase/topoisomerase IV subunit A
VLVRPTDDVLIANTGNQVVRASAQEVLAHAGKPIDSLIRLDADERVAAVATASSATEDAALVFIATDGGYGGLVRTNEIPPKKLGSRGARGQKEGKRSGTICTIESVPSHGDVVLATAQGAVLRFNMNELNIRRRNSVGLKLIALADGDRVVCGCVY